MRPLLGPPQLAEVAEELKEVEVEGAGGITEGAEAGPGPLPAPLPGPGFEPAPEVIAGLFVLLKH
jgi:hypothetical protein